MSEKNHSQPQQAVSSTNVVQNQPLSQAPMSIVRPNPCNKPLDGKGERDWNHGFYSCFDEPGTCCMVLFCPCIVYGKNHSRIEALRDTGKPHPRGGESCSAPCWASLLGEAVGIGCIFHILERGEIRRRYGIRGSVCHDCLAAYCCGPCQLTQEVREIEDEEEMTRR